LVHFDYYVKWVELFSKGGLQIVHFVSALIRRIQIRDIYFNIALEDEQEEALKEKYQPFLTGGFIQYDNFRLFANE
jgi:hypothetical protein